MAYNRYGRRGRYPAYRRMSVGTGFRGAYTVKPVRRSVINANDDNGVRSWRLSNKRAVTGPKRTGSLTQQVKSLQSYSRKHLPELKQIDVDTDATNLTIAGAVVNVTAVAQGTEPFERIGDTINITSIVIAGSVVPATDSTSRFYHRCALVQDLQTVGDTPPSAGAIFAGADPVLAWPELAATARFRLLWLSDLFDNGLGFSKNVLAADGATQSGAWSGHWEGLIKTSYNGAAATDIQKNAIYFVYLTTSTANTIDFNGNVRLTYSDA